MKKFNIRNFRLSERQFAYTEMITGTATMVAGAAGVGYLACTAALENLAVMETDMGAILADMSPRAVGSWIAIAGAGYFVQQTGIRRHEAVQEWEARQKTGQY